MADETDQGAAGNAQTEKDVEETAAAGQSQSGSDPDQDKTVGEPDAGSPPPDKSKGKGGKAKEPNAPALPPPPPARRVRVIVPEGTTLGPKLLVRGDETDDPDYVALLEVKGQKKVVLVK